MRLNSPILSLAAVAFVVVPAFAQDDAPPGASSKETGIAPEMTADQQALFGSWSSEQQEQFSRWPGDVQTYYWTLPRPRQELFWRLGDNDKIALTAMDESARISAWDMIERRMQALDPPTPEPEPDSE